ncbi:MAG TPA: hypothetical protein PLD84_05395 [Chitinophagales bacterium]|nr:hypothetical protein [Chitinophagales bacterium]
MPDFKKIAEAAAVKTDEQFAVKVSSLIRLNSPELLKLMNETGIDRASLSQLLNVLQKTTLSNQQKAEAIKKVNNGLGFLIGVSEKFLL